MRVVGGPASSPMGVADANWGWGQLGGENVDGWPGSPSPWLNSVQTPSRGHTLQIILLLYRMSKIYYENINKYEVGNYNFRHNEFQNKN